MLKRYGLLIIMSILTLFMVVDTKMNKPFDHFFEGIMTFYEIDKDLFKQEIDLTKETKLQIEVTGSKLAILPTDKKQGYLVTEDKIDSVSISHTEEGVSIKIRDGLDASLYLPELISPSIVLQNAALTAESIDLGRVFADNSYLNLLDSEAEDLDLRSSFCNAIVFKPLNVKLLDSQMEVTQRNDSLIPIDLQAKNSTLNINMARFVVGTAFDSTLILDRAGEVNLNLDGGFVSVKRTSLDLSLNLNHTTAYLELGNHTASILTTDSDLTISLSKSPRDFTARLTNTDLASNVPGAIGNNFYIGNSIEANKQTLEMDRGILKLYAPFGEKAGLAVN